MNIDSLTIGEAKQLAQIFTNNQAQSHGAIGKICIVRTYASGVHFGEVLSVSNNDGRSRCELKNSRRIWYWDGAFTLSAVANNGVNDNSKLSEIVSQQFIEDAIEFIPCKNKAIKNLSEIKAHEG